MEKTLRAIRDEVDGKYAHAFILTRNVKDLVWIKDANGNQRSVQFASALSRALSQPDQDQERPGVVAKYSISQGIMLYHNEQLVSESNDSVAQAFTRITGLQDFVIFSSRTATDVVRHATTAAYEVLPRLYPFLRNTQQWRASLVIERADFLIEDGPSGYGVSYGDRVLLELLNSWALDAGIRDGGGCVALLYHELGRVPAPLRSAESGFRIIPVEYPNHEERKRFLSSRDVPEERSTVLANFTTGFRRMDLDQVVRREMSDNDIARRKAELISARCGDTVELISAPHGMELANAQPHVKRYLEWLSKQIKANRKSPIIPMGILFVGVPGNGKSHLARAFAHDCGMNMLRFKNLRSRYVGESERNLETVLDLLPSLAPSVVFIDEVDQWLGARSNWGEGDGGVQQRLLGRLLEFLGNPDNRGDILWIGATNRPDLLDVATIRRFDRIFPFMNPALDERTALVKDLVQRLELPFSEDVDYKEVAKLMDDFSCDEVEKLLRRAYELSLSTEDKKITLDLVIRARRTFKHNYDELMHELVALLSFQACNFLSDLPWYDENDDIIKDKVPDFMKSMMNSQGDSLEPHSVTQRIEELRRIIATR